MSLKKYLLHFKMLQVQMISKGKRLTCPRRRGPASRRTPLFGLSQSTPVQR